MLREWQRPGSTLRGGWLPAGRAGYRLEMIFLSSGRSFPVMHQPDFKFWIRTHDRGDSRHSPTLKPTPLAPFFWWGVATSSRHRFSTACLSTPPQESEAPAGVTYGRNFRF